MATIQKIKTHLWFDEQAEEAVRFYTSIFKKSRITNVSYYGEVGYEIHHRPAGTVMTVEFELEGQQFIALNGGPAFRFSEAVSLLVSCETQEEIDYYWEKLSLGGDPNSQQCGWLKDKFGLSWQIVPSALAEMVSDANSERAGRVMNVMLSMKKLDLEELKAAYKDERGVLSAK